jgi:hypothetical protein
MDSAETPSVHAEPSRSIHRVFQRVSFPLSLQNDCATVLTEASSLDPKEQSITPRITFQVGYLELRSSVGYNSPEVGESS